MTHRATAFALLIAPMIALAPASAQEAAPEDEGSGFSLMQEGAQLLLRNLMSDMEPALDDMGNALSGMEPALRDLMVMIGDLRHYQAPEKLPNGDILIRRRPDAPPMPDAAEPEGALPLPELPLMAPGAEIEL